ncbi:hypothetical protein Z517_00004 [Fonsecaea pedrosoi CBS 271.37]|uniref:Protein kinase domain-containing protein n=1 Tax=Fonsecaea pedrosoi CBS 271.37 TaxID=1442368 RepID=A0A0D2E3I6_9EURO|nr:uncharacterized protein Z517_00004 [Fonsecaea pedrosoi CBS 271.37]KIW84616.1 hypothetical protein Z517_00004 [Fonsecaea pedrosoi CBS 271.37]
MSVVAVPYGPTFDTPYAHGNNDATFGAGDELDRSIPNPRCLPGPYSPGDKLFFKKMVDGECESYFTVVQVLEGRKGQGCTMSCCLLVTVHRADKAVPPIHHGLRYVLKVFDFKYSQGLRAQYNCGPFTLECAATLDQLTANDECLDLTYWRQENADLEWNQRALLEKLVGRASTSRLDLVRFNLDVSYADVRTDDPNFPVRSLPAAEKEAFLFTLMQQDYSHQRKCFDAVNGLDGFLSFITSGFIVRAREQATPAPQLHHYPVIITSFIEDANTLETLYLAKENPGAPENGAGTKKRLLLDEHWQTIHRQILDLAYRLWLQGLHYDDVAGANFLIVGDKPSQFRIVLVDVGGLKILDEEHVELYLRDRGRRRYLESKPEPLVQQYEDHTKYQVKEDLVDLEDKLQRLMVSIASPSYIKSNAFRSMPTKRFRRFGCGLQRNCDATVWRFLFETLVASLARSRFGEDPAMVAAILRHARQTLESQYIRCHVIAPWGYYAFLRMAVLFRPIGHPTDEIELLYPPKSKRLQDALQKCPGGAATIPFKRFQLWAKASDLWDDAPWSDPSVRSARVLLILEERQEEQSEGFISTLRKTTVITDELLRAGNGILWSEDDIARSRPPLTNDPIQQIPRKDA